MNRVRWWAGWRRPFAALAMAALAGILFSLPLAGQARAQGELDPFEKRQIEEEVLLAFGRIITLWQEELYFELYEEGWADSRARVSMEEFAQRMVELPWVPRGQLDTKFLRAELRHRTMVYIHARVRYQNRFNPEDSFEKDRSALMLKEDGRWRVDLVQLIRSPYS